MYFSLLSLTLQIYISIDLAGEILCQKGSFRLADDSNDHTPPRFRLSVAGTVAVQYCSTARSGQK